MWGHLAACVFTRDVGLLALGLWVGGYEISATP